MVSEIRIYVEGGGTGKETTTALRKGFGSFLGPWREMAWQQRRIKLHIITCGARFEAFSDFCTAVRSHPEALNLLLVDSETAVTAEPWQHLRQPEAGRMATLAEYNGQYHLMVQTMEAWLLADPDNLASFYGNGFNSKALPTTRDIEQVHKERLNAALLAATKDTKKGAYHKTKHGFELLGRSDPAKVRAAKHCDRFLSTIEKSLQ